MRSLLRVALLAVTAGTAAGQLHLPGGANSHPNSQPAPRQPAAQAAAPRTFDYYVLSLLWAPSHGVRFVVDGLWPRANDGANLESCGPVKAPSKGAMNIILPLMTSAALVRQEWEKHGSCTGLTAADYFTNIREARSAVQIPVQITSLEERVTVPREQIDSWFADANPGFPAGTFRVACEQGELRAIRVCFDSGMKPRECPASVGECAAPEVAIRPPV